MRQVFPRATERTQESPKYYGYDNEDSSGESTNSCPPNCLPPRRKYPAGDVESVQPSVIQRILDTAAQVEPILNPFLSPVIGKVTPTDPRIQPANQSSEQELIIDEEDM